MCIRDRFYMADDKLAGLSDYSDRIPAVSSLVRPPLDPFKRLAFYSFLYLGAPKGPRKKRKH